MHAINPKEAVKTETLRALRDTGALFRNVVTPPCKKRNVTLQQFYVLSELYDQSHQMATELADKAGILRTNFATVCHKMELRGLLKRERSDSDKRRVYLDLTDEGKALYIEIMEDIGSTLDLGSFVMSEQDYLSILEGAKALRKLLQEATR